NGQEIVRVNLGSSGEEVAFDQSTDGLSHEAEIYQDGSPDYFEISDPGSMLVEGTNVLAVQGHNVSLESSDMSLIPFLTIGRSGSGYTSQVSSYLSFVSGGLHTNFKIKAEGESIYLFDPSGMLVDSVAPVFLQSDISSGRKPDGTENWLYFGEPTPGEINSTPGVSQQAGDTVEFSLQGGWYPGGISLVLSSEDPLDSVFYTLDGSVPGYDDMLYSGAIAISANTVVRARVMNSSGLPGPVITNTYVVGTDHEFPIVCISTDPVNLWDELEGIYVTGPNAEAAEPHYGANYWQEWEKPVHFEYYDQSGTKQIDQGAGTKIFGGWSRMNDQKSLSLFARSRYGKGSFEYRFFHDKPIEEFEALVIRNSGNDNMRLQFHDGFTAGLTSPMDIDRQAFQPAVVYLNGDYWGIQNVREKVNEHFIAENHHVDPDSVDLLEYAGTAIVGNNEEYMEITDFLNSHSTLQDNSTYSWMAGKMDIDSYIQYQLTQIYIANLDWPGNNIKYWKTRSPASKWRWILYDTEYSYGIYDANDYSLNTLADALATDGPDWPNPPWATLLFRRMVTNLGFRYNFINQYCDRLNTDFSVPVTTARLDSFKTLYSTEIQYHMNRWWGTYEEWESRIEDRKTFARMRPVYARANMHSVFNLDDELEITVDVSDEVAGKIKLNSIYPKQYPFSGIYFENVPIKMTAIPKPGYKFVRWEGTVNSANNVIEYDMHGTGSFKAIFAEAGSADISIVINEVNYNSSSALDTKDWIEIMNNGQTTVDLSGWLLSDTGPDNGYYFSSYILAPNDYLIVCRELDAFRTYYPNVENSTGNLPFGLSSSGDMIRLYDNEGNLMDAVDYYVNYPWPENANGTGATIELIRPSLDNTIGENWQAIGTGGTPGQPNNGVLHNEELTVPEGQPLSFECFPNPFTYFTTIQFHVYLDGNYRLEIFDMSGRLIEIPVDEYLVQGTYYIDWNGSDERNGSLSGGVYNVRLSNENGVVTKRLIMIK
ncbi:MAG: CotH kinase family protein, partial [Bacteroidales bacterium]